jgi:hypothetical protein
VYHLEIRKFPKRVQRYNLDGPDVGAIVIPWVQDRVVDLGEQKWSPHTATITIFEGAEVSPDLMSLGRGWHTVERECQDVTGRVLAEARAAVAAGETGDAAAATGAVSDGLAPAGAGAAAPATTSASSDPLALGVELGALLGPDPTGLLAAWRAVAARSSGLTPSETLALAERDLASDG